MNIIKKYSLSIAAFALAGFMGACNEFTPETPELPDLPKVKDLQASVSNRVVTLNWQLPTSPLTIEGVTVKVNNGQEVYLSGQQTSYTVKGQPMEDEYLYTVKVNYTGGYVSEGESVIATVPFENLANVTNLEVTNIEGRTVTLSWTLPNVPGITGVLVGIDGNDVGSYTFLEGAATTVTLSKQPNGQHVNYRVLVQYDNYYTSAGETCPADIEYIESRTGFLLLASSVAELPDDDEKAAATWFYDNYVATDKGDFIAVADLPTIEFEEYGVIWIIVDRVGLEVGWQNLPSELVSNTTIDALKAYGLEGGSLYLSNMATQLTVPLEIVPANMPINAFGSGAGGDNGDLWSINPHLGWIFQDSGQYYDRSSHAVFAGLNFENVNGYEYSSLPLLGGDYKEDHNSLWDINPYWNEAGNPAPNCVAWFENVTNSQVLAVWGQVADHCIAGMVDFNANDIHGRCIAMGLGAYEWNVNNGTNPYQGNIEKLTENILNYLK